MVQAVADRPNITGHVAYHTFSGVHLRPYAGYADEHFPTEDLRAYELIGEEATRLTGYPAVSVFHGFKYDPKTSIRGGGHDWLYDHMGVFSWTTEFWSPQRRAGIEDVHPIEWIRDHPVEDDLKLLRWNDAELDGSGYVDWYEFEHPQLGPVELGGWDDMYFWGNVPAHLLEEEIAPHADWALFHLLISPRLEVASFEAERLGSGAHLVRLVLWNTGWLPTYVTRKAVERKVARPIEVELELPEGVRLAAGERRVEAGQLEGRVQFRSTLWFGADPSTTDRTKHEWVVEGAGELAVVARHERAGTARASITLG
jgi:hypothetical protein